MDDSGCPFAHWVRDDLAGKHQISWKVGTEWKPRAGSIQSKLLSAIINDPGTAGELAKRLRVRSDDLRAPIITLKRHDKIACRRENGGIMRWHAL